MNLHPLFMDLLTPVIPDLEERLIHCEECDGKREFYFNAFDEEVTKAQYNADPSAYAIECENCKGRGYTIKVIDLDEEAYNRAYSLKEDSRK